MKIEQHPIYQVPTPEMARRMAAMRQIPEMEAFRLLFEERAKRIAQEKMDPLRFGFEPSVWRVADALLGLDWAIPEVFGKTYGPKMRRRLGFDMPVQVLLVNGGQRGGKTTYMVKRALQGMLRFPKTTLWGFHSSLRMSVDYQQADFWRFFPPELRKSVNTRTTHIQYKMKNGFSDGSGFILPNMSRASFRYYGQDRNDAIEGGELGAPGLNAAGIDEHGRFMERCVGCIADELIPADWVETLVYRLATHSALMVIGFTPVDGYTNTVKLFLERAEAAKLSVGYLLPKDGKDPLLEQGLQRENCDEWLVSEDAGRVVSGREFEMVPRVMRCADPGKAVVFFHSSDNAYGGARQVAQRALVKDRRWRLERFYGVAEKLVAGKFPLFKESVHCIPRSQIPLEGTDYLVVDPCDGRNFFMLLIRAAADGRAYVMKEWPSAVDPVPGYGVLGDWAVTSADAKWFDGRPGPAQDSLGWGLLQYKAEVARLEEWECWKDGASLEEIDKWDQWGPTRRRKTEKNGTDDEALNVNVARRILDARMASADALQADSARSLFEEFDQVGLTFGGVAGAERESVAQGVRMINDALWYNVEQRVTKVLNEPKLYVADDCRNVIFALQVWTGADGGKGATKDPIDCLRMFYLQGCSYAPEREGSSVEAGETIY